MLANTDLGKLTIRLTLGGLMLFHGIDKLMNGVGFIEAQLVSHNLPAFLAWGVIIGEVLAPLMIILGFHTRAGALLIVANMLVALALVHSHQLMLLGSNGGLRLELQFFFLMSAVTVFFLGSGRYTLRD